MEMPITARCRVFKAFLTQQTATSPTCSFPIEHAHFKVDGTFLTGCQTIPNLLQLIMAFFRIACRK